jgi:hypothetical protein
MKTFARDLYLSTARVDASKARLIAFVLTLVMFAIAAGAPEAGSDFIR